MGFLSNIFGGGKQQSVAPSVATKPISPVTNRATVEGTRRRSLLAEATTKPKKSLLNQETDPLG